MRYFIYSALFLIMLSFGSRQALAYAPGVDSSMYYPDIAAYIVKQTDGKKVYMTKDADRIIQPASLTKILTSIIAIESGKLDQEVLIAKEATLVEPTKAGFKPGDRVKLVDLVKAAMVSSSNDAAFAIAIHLSGSVERFVTAMNYRAKKIGMKRSNFTNPAGFDKGIYAGNISTAEDLLVLTEYAIRNNRFNEIAQLESVLVTELNSRKMILLKTHNKLLAKYPYAVGIKTGFTRRAGKCLIARAQKENRDLLLVMLNAQGDRWLIAEEMFEKAFAKQSGRDYAANEGIDVNYRPWKR
ncbi:MAG: D-alanyl-D-alanine carboxypeptidase [Chlorobium sp.]|uniref:D-alanyl-D-alanine carboxypeptidase family protein n=1 Tax=Chlorobium sp. TaxID=1095 RepID=UPI0025BDCFE4|nr:serine hydrolase [Chlorobium sp.]MCF8215984.1 D-alanyl-D-alanine carboxypeptidase [Chlorobium sp.]MCF8270493.1 D-alanyl-D-alanine carboxypeptidase [Chlorobium sp.]MCF8287259.1 D-alanyl-D-alanine carboxypeptidase [Chlorobium sp.]MCF8290461.1 D-alanyl-D-alanine carboxypeptidase [Chlorobium sp.]MCF8384695.1 D-alanyl-D-alanine carboxypeptidase [Chlorobium sp.]